MDGFQDATALRAAVATLASFSSPGPAPPSSSTVFLSDASAAGASSCSDTSIALAMLLPVTLGLVGNSLNIGWFVWVVTGIVAWQAGHSWATRS